MYKTIKGNPNWLNYNCANKRSAAGCKSKPANYFKFEKAMFRFLAEVVSLDDLFKDSSGNGELVINKCDSLHGQILELENKIEKWVDAIADENSPELTKRLKDRIEKAEIESHALKIEHEKILKENAAKLHLDKNKAEFVKDFQELIIKVQDGNNEIKAKFRIQLLDLIKTIYIGGGGKFIGINF